MKIAEYARKALEVLEAEGFEAYIVGGSVRDLLLGKEPYDYDICTNALPEQTLDAFSQYVCFTPGMKHGTVAVMLEGHQLEITTYRTEGGYLNHRSPESVTFVSSLDEDLSRRDFTINSMCISKDGDVIDRFGGLSDLNASTIRAIGNPEKRFTEDALRIMRALRFSSQLGFAIEGRTADAMDKCRRLLDDISAERKLSELKKIICGENAFDVLMKHRNIIAQIVPEAACAFDYNQYSKHHCYDVWEHTCRALSNIEPNETLRLAMLYHDLGKPHVAVTDKKGFKHFHRHMNVSAQIAKASLNELRCDKKTMNEIVELVKHHDVRFEAEHIPVRRFISEHDWDFFNKYMKIRYADTMAQSDYMREEKLEILDNIMKVSEEIRNSNDCLFLNELAINGDDAVSLGYSGKDIAKCLSFALNSVIEDKCENEKSALLTYIKENFN